MTDVEAKVEAGPGCQVRKTGRRLNPPGEAGSWQAAEGNKAGWLNHEHLRH